MDRRNGRGPHQPESLLYTDTPYKLAGPESTDLVPAGQAAQPESTKSPREWLLFVVWRQKWLVLAVLLLSAAAAAAYMRLATPVYSSTARIYVQPAGPLLGSGQPGLTQPNSNRPKRTPEESIGDSTQPSEN